MSRMSPSISSSLSSQGARFSRLPVDKSSRTRTRFPGDQPLDDVGADKPRSAGHEVKCSCLLLAHG